MHFGTGCADGTGLLGPLPQPGMGPPAFGPFFGRHGGLGALGEGEGKEGRGGRGNVETWVSEHGLFFNLFGLPFIVLRT